MPVNVCHDGERDIRVDIFPYVDPHFFQGDEMALYTEVTTDKPTMIEVRIRTDEYASTESVFLCTAPLFALESVIAEVKRWGVYTDQNGSGPYTDMSGQFVVTDQAFFEIVLHDGTA